MVVVDRDHYLGLADKARAHLLAAEALALALLLAMAIDRLDGDAVFVCFVQDCLQRSLHGAQTLGRMMAMISFADATSTLAGVRPAVGASWSAHAPGRAARALPAGRRSVTAS